MVGGGGGVGEDAGRGWTELVRIANRAALWLLIVTLLLFFVSKRLTVILNNRKVITNH